MTIPPFENLAVESAFGAFEAPARSALQCLRGWIYEVAATDGRVGALVEDLKWGQPSYATKPKSGVPVRLGQPKDRSSCALYVPCQSAVVAELRDHYDGQEPSQIWFEGNRGIHFDPTQPMPEDELRHAIALALTYYARRKAN